MKINIENEYNGCNSDEFNTDANFGRRRKHHKVEFNDDEMSRYSFL